MAWMVERFVTLFPKGKGDGERKQKAASVKKASVKKAAPKKSAAKAKPAKKK